MVLHFTSFLNSFSAWLRFVFLQNQLQQEKKKIRAFSCICCFGKDLHRQRSLSHSLETFEPVFSFHNIIAGYVAFIPAKNKAETWMQPLVGAGWVSPI